MSRKAGEGLSHLDASGRARMVSVSEKAPSRRRALAESFVRLSPKTLGLIAAGKMPKGDAIGTARIAGIMAAKRAAELIPLCHPLNLTHAEVRAEVLGDGVRFEAEVMCTERTGVEMEALTAASIAALTLYDMVKAVEHAAVIERVRLLEKTGGKLNYRRR